MTDPQTVVANPAPLTGTERVRRTRQRKRNGIMFLGIEIRPSEREALIRAGLLNKAERESKNAVQNALYAYFEKYLESEARSPA